MSKNICYVQDCERPVRCKDLCKLHYDRMRTTGTTDIRRPTEAERWDQSSSPEGDCVVWRKGLKNGYGLFSPAGSRTQVYAHRYAYELEHGPIPEGMIVDHTCWNRACVNPDHLRLATRQQNNRNRSGAMPRSGTGIRGVSRHPKGGYRARVSLGDGGQYERWHSTIEAAAADAKAAREMAFGEFRGGD